MNRIATLTFGFVVLAGCPGDDSAPGDSGAASTGAQTDDTTTTGTPPAGTTTGDSAEDTAGPTTTDPGTTTGEPPGTTTGNDGSTTDEPGSTGGANACAPDPADDDCGACVKMNCCDQFEACNADVDCTCFTDCAEMNPGIPGALQCGSDCGVNPLDTNTPTGALSACTQAMCPVCLG